MTPQQNNPALVRALNVLIVFALLGLVGEIFMAVHALHSTGALDVTTSTSTAAISVSRDGSEAKIIGTGEASIRLTAGSYVVVASDSGKTARTTAQVTVGGVKTVQLKLQAITTSLGSADKLSLTGTDALLNNGLTPAQVTNFRQDVYVFKPSAKTIAIAPSSVVFGPQDPNNPDPTLSIFFNVSIDGTLYNATTKFIDLTSIELLLKDAQTGQQVYDSGPLPPVN